MTTSRPGCLTSLMRLPSSLLDWFASRRPSTRTDRNLPYRLRDDFLSPAEAAFYHVLNSMCGDHLTICPKVPLSDIFFVSRRETNYQAYLNKIHLKHADFLICDPKTMKPRFAIELDDSSHQRHSRLQRDEFVEQVYSVAGLPLVRVPVQPSYDTKQLAALFKQALQTKTAEVNQPVAIISPSPVSQSSPPLCPKCGAPMLLRHARRGSLAGESFFGCSNYPHCSAVVPVKRVSEQ